MTLAGPGGIGKTRLGIRVAEEFADEFTDGVCFDSLAPIREPELVISTIARTLGCAGARGRQRRRTPLPAQG
jgi:predicted ATPase